MGKLEEKVNDILGIKEESTPVGEMILQENKVPVPRKEDPKKDDIENDYKYSRENYYNLIERGQDAIQGILDVAKEGQHPRAYEVAGALIKNVADTVDKLQDLQGKLQKLKDVPNKTTANIKNALFVGSTTELQKMLNKEKTTSEKMQDELEPIVVEPEKKDDK
jgi:hypothetical protein|tara:strand:- start:286 stop:777 length:492 start_codon:yes stop_codon:yes gene_type:complete